MSTHPTGHNKSCLVYSARNFIFTAGKRCSTPSVSRTAWSPPTFGAKFSIRQRLKNSLFRAHLDDRRSFEPRIAGVSCRKPPIRDHCLEFGSQPFTGSRRRSTLPVQVVPPIRGLPISRTDSRDVQSDEQVGSRRYVDRINRDFERERRGKRRDSRWSKVAQVECFFRRSTAARFFSFEQLRSDGLSWSIFGKPSF